MSFSNVRSAVVGTTNPPAPRSAFAYSVSIATSTFACATRSKRRSSGPRKCDPARRKHDRVRLTIASCGAFVGRHHDRSSALNHARTTVALATFSFAAVFARPIGAAAQSAQTPPPPSVVLNGTAIVFDQPPIARDGRVYVPLRGIFEQLGASVVYNAGRIAATAGKHTVGLQIGSTTATVDGVVETLDAPPIVETGRTLVPLRFVSQALGANVSYDATTRTVNVTAPDFAPGAATTVGTAPVAPAPVAVTPSAGAEVPAAPTPPAPQRATIALRPGETQVLLRLLRLEPAANATIARNRPEISATFGESVEPSSVRVALDGEDVTSQAEISGRSFLVDAPAELAAGHHEISIAGRTSEKEPFAEHWAFTTRAAVDTNFLSGLEPVSGLTLGSTTFPVSGYTRPHARVRVIATTSATALTFADPTDASATEDTVADAHGYFETTLSPTDHGSGLIDVRIASTAPDGDIAVRTLRLRL